MILVLLTGISFVLAVLVLGLLEFAIVRLHRPTASTQRTLKAVMHGLGFLATLPFVLAILVTAQGWTVATWLAAGMIVLAAAISFGIALVSLVNPMRVTRTPVS